MTNTNLLKAKMVENGYTMQTLSEALKINRSTLCDKINNKRSFDTEQVYQICDLLNITEDTQKCNIFLWQPSQN